MKKLLSVILTLLVSLSCVPTAFAASGNRSDFGAYKHIVILGIDGAGAFFDNTPTPNMDKIFAENSFVCNNAKAEIETSSAQNWSSILMGVEFKKHQIDNDIAGAVERTSAEKYPTVFRTVRENMPDAILTSICNWDSINFGIIENDVGVNKDTGNDPEVCQKVIDSINGDTPTLLFVQFDDVDHAGHDKGFGTKTHLEAITVADGYIGAIYDAIEGKGIANETLFIVVSDHGGTRLGGHGMLTFGEKFVYVGVKGKTVGENNTYGVRNRDVASIVLYALGIEPTADMTSKVPNGLFEGYENKENGFFDKLRLFFDEVLMKIINSFADFGGKF